MAVSIVPELLQTKPTNILLKALTAVIYNNAKCHETCAENAWDDVQEGEVMTSSLREYEKKSSVFVLLSEMNFCVICPPTSVLLVWVFNSTVQSWWLENDEWFTFSRGNLTRQFYFAFENEIEEQWQVDTEVKKNHDIDLLVKANSGKDGTWWFLLGSHFLDPEEWLILFGAVHTTGRWAVHAWCLVVIISLIYVLN